MATLDRGGGGGGGGVGGGDSPSSPSGGGPSLLTAWSVAASRRYQHYLDKASPHVMRRWAWFGMMALVYGLRVLLLQGFYVVSYGLAIYVLQLLIAFLSPQVDPEFQDLVDGPALPTKASDEFRPFVRRLPEFKFWYSIMKAFCIAFVMTFFSAFDVPVFWPILLFYWLVLFTVTMKRQILHMIKYKYVPFTFGKQVTQASCAALTVSLLIIYFSILGVLFGFSFQRYTGKRGASMDDTSLASD